MLINFKDKSEDSFDEINNIKECNNLSNALNKKFSSSNNNILDTLLTGKLLNKNNNNNNSNNNSNYILNKCLLKKSNLCLSNNVISNDVNKNSINILQSTISNEIDLIKTTKIELSKSITKNKKLIKYKTINTRHCKYQINNELNIKLPKFFNKYNALCNDIYLSDSNDSIYYKYDSKYIGLSNKYKNSCLDNLQQNLQVLNKKSGSLFNKHRYTNNLTSNKSFNSINVNNDINNVKINNLFDLFSFKNVNNLLTEYMKIYNKVKIQKNNFKRSKHFKFLLKNSSIYYKHYCKKNAIGLHIKENKSLQLDNNKFINSFFICGFDNQIFECFTNNINEVIEVPKIIFSFPNEINSTIDNLQNL